MATSPADRHSKSRQMDQSCRVESGTHHLDEHSMESRKTSQEMEDDLETTQSNDLENNNTWLVTAMNINEREKKERQHAQHVIDD